MTSETLEVDQVVVLVVDAFGLLCPLPIIRTAAGIKKIEAGQVLRLESTDPGVIEDMKDWCKANRHQYLGDAVEGRVRKVWVRKDSADSTKA